MLLLLAPLAFAADTLPWELAGIYDAAALVRSGGVPSGELVPPGVPGPAPAMGGGSDDWLWQPADGMNTSCGAAKSPDGLGVMEAQAVADGLTPALVVLLRRTDDKEAPLDTSNLHVSIASASASDRWIAGAASYPLLGSALQKIMEIPAVRPDNPPLAPFVEHAPVAVTIYGDAARPDKVLVRTQLAMELCLEHKTGRAWTGNVNKKLREAFLLSAPDESGPESMYFRGQADPVPALVRPPDACLIEKTDALDGPDEQPASAWDAGMSPGAASLRLVPADVWGASLRPCDPEEISGEKAAKAALKAAQRAAADPTAAKAPPQQPDMPLTMSAASTPTAPLPWRQLLVHVYQKPDTQEPWLRVDLGDSSIIADTPLYQSNGTEGRRGLRDILAAVPEPYPTRGKYPNELTVLVIPNWQIVNALESLQTRVDGGATGPRVSDGVGWVLEHPDRLLVQVGTLKEGEKSSLPNLTSKFAGASGAFFRWGYMVGSHAGRSDIVLTSRSAPTWDQIADAQRAPQQALFLGSVAISLVLLGAGLRRVPDLWTRVPQERVSYWPASGESDDKGPTPQAPLGESELPQ